MEMPNFERKYSPGNRHIILGEQNRQAKKVYWLIERERLLNLQNGKAHMQSVQKYCFSWLNNPS